MYVYWQSEPNLWTVGYYSPDGERHPESDHDTPEKAAERVHWLNGGEIEQPILRPSILSSGGEDE